MRDAHRRLETIYKATAPEQKEADAADAALDEFTRLKKKIHQEMKQIRQVRRWRLLLLILLLGFKGQRSLQQGWRNYYRDSGSVVSYTCDD